MGSNLCLSSPTEQRTETALLSMKDCQENDNDQQFYLSNQGEVRKEVHCLDYNNQALLMFNCHGVKGAQLWSYENNVIFPKFCAVCH